MQKMQKIAGVIALGVGLTVGPVARASADERGGPSAPTGQRASAVESPDVELQAVDDTLSYGQQQLARRHATVGTPATAGVARAGRSSAEAELDALTAAPASENAAHGAALDAFTWDSSPGGAVPAAEAELHALLQWQDTEERAGSALSTPPRDAPAVSERDGAVEPRDDEAFASDAHDDAGLSPGGAYDPNLGSRAKQNGQKPRQAAVQDPHAAATDDCACS